MKFLAISLSFIGSLALAQTMGIKDIPADGDTTIKIEKGAKTDNKFEITEGADTIEGEAAPLLKEARSNWKTACTDWKKEFKDLNKGNGNQIISMGCGTMKCSTTAMETTCSSEAKHKVKVQVK